MKAQAIIKVNYCCYFSLYHISSPLFLYTDVTILYSLSEQFQSDSAMSFEKGSVIKSSKELR